MFNMIFHSVKFITDGLENAVSWIKNSVALFSMTDDEFNIDHNDVDPNKKTPLDDL